MTSSEDVKSALEWTGLVMEIAQAIGTVMIGLAGFAWSAHEKSATEYNNRRQLMSEAASQIDMDFAMSMFKDRTFEQYSIGEGDFHQILSLRFKFPTVAWHRKCRSRLMVFLETIRPIAHIIGKPDGELAIEGQIDPILFKFRLSMLALGDFWSPQGGLKSMCNDEHREYIREIYGDQYEWHLLCTACSRIGFKGRFVGPWDNDNDDDDPFGKSHTSLEVKV